MSIVGQNPGNTSYCAAAFVPGSVRPASPKPSLRNTIGVDRPILSKFQGSLNCNAGISASAHGNGSSRLSSFAAKSISVSQQASGAQQPSLSYVPCRVASVALPQMSLTYVGPVLSSSSSSTQTNVVQPQREAMQSRLRSARSPPRTAHPIALSGGVLSRDTKQASIKIRRRSASPAKLDDGAMDLSASRTYRTESNKRGSVVTGIERSFTQVPFCGALAPVPASPLLGMRFTTSPSPAIRAASPQEVNRAGLPRNVAVPLLHFCDERAEQNRAISQERNQTIVLHRPEQADLIRYMTPRTETEGAGGYARESLRKAPAVEQSQSTGNLSSFRVEKAEADIPNSADLDMQRAKLRDIAPFSPSESMRSLGTLDPNPPSEYGGSLTAASHLARVVASSLPELAANSQSASDHTCFEGKTAAIVAEAAAKADKSAILVNQATAKALEDALARVKELEAALSEERRSTDELKITFASELMNQHSAHERDIKALEETVMKLMSDKEQLTALLERRALPKSESAEDIVSSRDPTSSSSKDTTAGGSAFDSLEEPTTC